MTCKHCNATIPENGLFCPICGQKVEAEMAPPPADPVKYCRFCGGTMNPDALFCSHCGKRQEPAAPAVEIVTPPPVQVPVAGAVPQQEVPATVKPKKKGLLIGGIAAAVVAIGVLVAFLLGLFETPESLARKVMKAVEKCDGEALVDMFPKKYLDYAMDEEGYDKDDLVEELEEYFERRIRNYGDLESWEIEEIETYKKGDDFFDEGADELEDELGLKINRVAAVTVEAEHEEGDFTYYLVLVKVGLKWYLLGIS